MKANYITATWRNPKSHILTKCAERESKLTDEGSCISGGGGGESNSYIIAGVPFFISHLLDQQAALGDTARQLRLTLGRGGDPAKELATIAPAYVNSQLSPPVVSLLWCHIFFPGDAQLALQSR